MGPFFNQTNQRRSSSSYTSWSKNRERQNRVFIRRMSRVWNGADKKGRLTRQKRMTLWWWWKTVSRKTRSISQGGRHHHSPLDETLCCTHPSCNIRLVALSANGSVKQGKPPFNKFRNSGGNLVLNKQKKKETYAFSFKCFSHSNPVAVLLKMQMFEFESQSMNRIFFHLISSSIELQSV